METLDKQKLRIELARQNRSHAWVAKQLGFSRQYYHSLVKKESVKHLDKVAVLLDTTRRSLIK